MWLYNLHISPYEPATRWNEAPDRRRKLLLRRHEIRRLVGKVEEKGPDPDSSRPVPSGRAMRS